MLLAMRMPWTGEDADTESKGELPAVPLIPVTANPLPFGSKPKPKKVKPLSAETLRKEFQNFLNRIQMPMSLDKLTKTPTGALRAIASLLRAYDGANMREFTRDDLIAFIRGYQQEPENFWPLRRLPGIEYPDLDDQSFRQLFEDKKDPWKRPSRP